MNENINRPKAYIADLKLRITELEKTVMKRDVLISGIKSDVKKTEKELLYFRKNNTTLQSRLDLIRDEAKNIIAELTILHCFRMINPGIQDLLHKLANMDGGK